MIVYREIKYKDEEIQRLKREHDASKHDKDSFRFVYLPFNFIKN